MQVIIVSKKYSVYLLFWLVIYRSIKFGDAIILQNIFVWVYYIQNARTGVVISESFARGFTSNGMYSLL